MNFSAVLLSLVALSSVEAVRLSSSSSSVERILKGKDSGKSGKSGTNGNGNEGGNNCDICVDGRPDEITFKYVPADTPGPYENFEKHTCILYDSFPATATLTVKDKSGGTLYQGVVNDGDEFTVTGPFDADSFFEFAGFTGLDNGGNSCIVHTSCSDDILAGYENRIGPFEVVLDECKCIYVDKPSTGYVCDEDIIVNFDLDWAPLSVNSTPTRTDWVGFYPCDQIKYYHSVNWQWACGSTPSSGASDCVATTAAELTFDSVLPYAAFGPNTQWPLSPGCWKAVILRNEGPSVPPYIPICETPAFNVTC